MKEVRKGEGRALERVVEVVKPVARAATGVGLIATGTPVGIAAGVTVLALEGGRIVANSYQERWDAELELAQLRALRQRAGEAGARGLAAQKAENDRLEERVRILREAARAYGVR